jgi:hypothetical protein
VKDARAAAAAAVDDVRQAAHEVAGDVHDVARDTHEVSEVIRQAVSERGAHEPPGERAE